MLYQLHDYIITSINDHHSIPLFTFSRHSNGVPPDNNHGNHGNHSGHVSPSTPPSIEEALKIIHDTERPHASLGLGPGDNGFFLHGAEPPGPQSPGDDPGSAKAQPDDHDPNSASTEEVDTGIHVRTEDIQSLDEDSSSLRDYSDIDPDCEATTRSCPLPNTGERERAGRGGEKGGLGDGEGEGDPGGERSSPCPSSVPTLPRSHTASPASSSGGSGGAMVRMTSFAEQKFRKLEGRSSGGTTPESSDLNVPCTGPSRAISPEVRSYSVSVSLILLQQPLFFYNSFHRQTEMQVREGKYLCKLRYTVYLIPSISPQLSRSLVLPCQSHPLLRSRPPPETPPTCWPQRWST